MGGNKKRSLERQLSFYKDEVAQPTLSGNNLRVLNLLSTGAYTNVEIGQQLQLPDPRSNIRYIRNAGYYIADYWIRVGHTKCKRYFLKNI